MTIHARTAGRVGTVLLVPLLLVQCAEEQRTLNVRGDFTIVRENGATASLPMEGRLYDELIGERAFADAWAIVTRGAAPYEALALTLTSVGEGEPDPVPLLAGLVIAVPTPFRRGVRYPIGGAFPPPIDAMPLYWNTWGRRTPSEAGMAEIALRTFDYHTVGMRIENEFIATDAEGFIEVITRGDDYIELRLDLTAREAAGGEVRVQGDMRVAAERYTPPVT